ncbi:hypothetical protein [Maritimibacter sp. DP1N21-5]|uniref:hypothetical protein n=1 Tax=Maritimibacter sp. DP1N21-5 TaxID=2836867 RepID=UPI001C491AE2|nr:hypothetical protein [Maritimibacter sp. DP1N21-5]MBV7407973.1 hypothetical protein [Maritimibacter sp. DP1N21-5]
MRRLLRWGLRAGLAIVLIVVVLMLPVARNELSCTAPVEAQSYVPLLPEGQRRAEARTLMTYPEWHIVHAYDDYGRVIADGDPHDFGYLRAIGGYWSSLCALTKASGALGGVDGSTKQLVYVIGVSFTAELLLKAVYEETLGRIATWIGGRERAPLDELSARQAADYARFLQQTPWYLWDFDGAQAELAAASTGVFRDRERRFALGVENRAKAAYAAAIAAAVAATGNDALTLRMVVTGAFPLPEGAREVGTLPEGPVIETPRYRVLTGMIDRMATQGAEFLEIAGNDDILLTAISPEPEVAGALFSFARQGYGDYRHLILVKVADLASTLRGLSARGLVLEHVHDY